MEKLKIALDCDGVISCFAGGVIQRAKDMGLEEHFPKTCKDIDCWNISEKFSEVMSEMWEDPNFWLSLKPLKGALPLLFTPTLYITARPINSAVTKQWLKKWGLPSAPVVTVSNPEHKIAYLIMFGIDLYVDDLHTTVIQAREAGFNAILHETPYHKSVQEECKGLPTIKSVNDILKYQGGTI